MGKTFLLIGSWLGLVMCLPIATCRSAQADGGDLDRVLRLLGHGAVLNNERLYLNDSHVEVHRGERWIQDVEQLPASRTPAVANAAARLKPAIEMLNQAADVEKKSKELLVKLAKQNGPSLGDAVSVASSLDAFDIDLMVQKRLITRDEGDEYLRLRGKAGADVLGKFGRLLADTMTLNSTTYVQTYRLRNRSDVLRNDVLFDVLLPAVRSRAGGVATSAPVDVKLADFPDFDNNNQIHKTDVLVIIRSRADQELTRLTLLLELHTNVGWRRAVLYLQKLPVSAACRLDPIALSAMFLNDGSKDPLARAPQISRIRYSLWCDQLRTEDQEPTTMPRPAIINEGRLLALAPGLDFISGPGMNTRLTGREYEKARDQRAYWKMEPEPAGRFVMVMRKLTRQGDGHEVELELTDLQQLKPQPQLFRGVVRLPEDHTLGVWPEEKVEFTVTSGSQEMQMKLVEGGGLASWRASRSISGRHLYHQFVSDSHAPRNDSPEAIAKRRLWIAYELAQSRNYSEAKKTCEAVAADHPGTQLADWARQEIAGLDELKALHQVEDQAKRRVDDEIRKQIGAGGKPPLLGAGAPLAPPARMANPPIGNLPAAPAGDAESVTTATVDDVEYVFQGAVRSGTGVVVTLLATSNNGDRPAPNVPMTVTDEQGHKHFGQLMNVLGARSGLKEGKVVKLAWKFGGTNAFSGAKAPVLPSDRQATYSSVTLYTLRGAIEFRNVPAIKKSGAK